MPDFLSRPSLAIDAAFKSAGRGLGPFPPWEAKFDWSISMTVYPMISLWILVLTAATLFWVALTDLREFKVRNELVIILACLYVGYALFSGAWVSMQWNFAFALLMLAGGIYAYSLQHIGGGDLKLLTVAFLWTGPWLAAPFVVLLLLFTGIYYVAARLGFAAARRTSAGLRIPLAPSLAGALIGVFALGLIGPHV
jgi:prepilin peptidase CpaA